MIHRTNGMHILFVVPNARMHHHISPMHTTAISSRIMTSRSCSCSRTRTRSTGSVWARTCVTFLLLVCLLPVGIMWLRWWSDSPYKYTRTSVDFEMEGSKGNSRGPVSSDVKSTTTTTTTATATATEAEAEAEAVTMNLRPHVSIIGTTEIYYQLPETAIQRNNNVGQNNKGKDNNNNNNKGILVFFHGCNHGGQDFFMLPEDRLVARAALDRGLAVLSITSADRRSGCWSKTRDLKDLSTVFDTWIQQVNLSPELPRIGMGASSGGAFLFSAYKVLKFNAMASYIMWKSFAPEDRNAASTSTTTTAAATTTITLPATAFVYMPRDERAHAIIPKLARELTQIGVSNRVWSVQPHPLTPQLCAQRIPELGMDRCTDFLNNAVAVAAAAAAPTPDLLIGTDYTILEPYSSGKWDTYFSKAQLDTTTTTTPDAATLHIKKEGNQPNLLAFDNHSWLWASMVEEIAVSYGRHEMTAEYRDDVLDWLMEQSGILSHGE